jgi:hypothetical protein
MLRKYGKTSLLESLKIGPYIMALIWRWVKLLYSSYTVFFIPEQLT